MTPITDEQVMRRALADLTSDQPPVPPGRFQAVRRRAIRYRKRQLAGAAASALAVVAIGIGAGRLPGFVQQPTARHVPGWALAWPDYRNGSVPQSVLDNAVLAWGDPAKTVLGSTAPSSPRDIARLLASYHVTWYVGQTVAHGKDVAVIFEASSPDTGRQLVVGVARASEVMSRQPAWKGDASPWALTATAAPARPKAFGPDISEYLPELSASGKRIDNWIVVLTAPDTRLRSWSAAIPGRGYGGGVVHPAGVYVANVGQVTSDVILTFASHGRTHIPVGIAGHAPEVPALAPPPALTHPASFHPVFSQPGQGNQTDDIGGETASAGPYAVLGRCYNAPPIVFNGLPTGASGHGPLEITINGHSIGTIACDGQQHDLTVPRSLVPRHRMFFGKRSSAMTSWQIAFGRTR